MTFCLPATLADFLERMATAQGVGVQQMLISVLEAHRAAVCPRCEQNIQAAATLRELQALTLVDVARAEKRAQALEVAWRRAGNQEQLASWALLAANKAVHELSERVNELSQRLKSEAENAGSRAFTALLRIRELNRGRPGATAKDTLAVVMSFLRSLDVQS